MKIIASSRPVRRALLVAGWSVLSALGSGFTGHESREPTPLPMAGQPLPGNASRGRMLFGQSCAHCHGDDAHGSGEDSDGPDLYGLAIGNARIAAVIRTGIPGEMPSFAKKHQAPDIADLTSYLRTLH